MSDAVSSAKNARESLARGLTALQSDPNVPQKLLELAAPIAQAMGALHQIERTGQLNPHADIALNHVRTALSQLQAQPSQHPAVQAAMEAVAGSLGTVHGLSQMAKAPAAPPPPAAAPRPPTQPQQPAYAPQQAQANPFAATAVAPNMPPPAPMPAQRPPTQPQAVARDPFAAPQHAPAPQAAPPPAPPGAVAGPAAGRDLPQVPADLGAHSPTNFYKGLSGNDIIDHGGLFVSTYKIPKIGTPIRLKVSLPGGYEFEANAVVRWAREQSDGGQDAPPGFGAQFTEITAEARQLVYRYVRNREPMFHDDL